MPAIAPVPPNASGTALTDRVVIPAGTAPFAQSGKRFSGAAVGYRLEGSGFNIPSISLKDTALSNCNIGFRSYGQGVIGDLLVERMHLPNGRWTSGIPSGLIYSQGTRLMNAVFRDLLYNTTQKIAADDNCACIALTGKGANDIGDNILIEDFDLRGLDISVSSAYPNTDGIAVERGYNGLLIRRGVVYDMEDAGYDIKSVVCRLDDVRAENCRQPFKFWTPNHHGALYGVNPRFAQIIVTSEEIGAWDEPMVIDHLSCRSSTGLFPILRAERGARQIIIKSHDLSGCPPGTPLLSKDSYSAATTVTWEQGTPGNGVTL